MTTTQKSKPLNIALWAAQVVLAGMLIMAGIMKSTTPIEQLAVSLPWADDIPELLVRFIGIAEFLGALGLLLPSLLKIKPNLTPLAASGIAVIMLFAVGFHIARNEFPAIGFNLMLGSIALFIVWGRFKKVVIGAKGV